MTHSQLVLDGLRTLGPLSDYDLFHYAKLRSKEGVKPSPSSIRTRRKELVESGMITDSGRRERTPSGRKAILWRLK